MIYQEILNDFSWDSVLKTFDWTPNQTFNMAFQTCDRWADDANLVAIYWEDEAGNKEKWTYQKLKEKSNRMANLLRSLGVTKGDRIAGLLGKDMELIVTVLAVWKIGAIYVPLFTAFGPEALEHRLNDSECKFLVTNKEQKKKIEGKNISVQTILIDGLFQGELTFMEYVDTFSAEYKIEFTNIMDPCVIQYTSGSTGLAKGAVWAHKILVSIYPYQIYAVGTQKEDRFFGGADLGWAYGLIQSTFAPLSFGVPILIYKGKFKTKKVYQLLQDYEITSFAYAPTAYRAMMAEGSELVKQYKFKVKKFSSAGEPLNAEVVRFFKNNFGREIYDHYGATEAGMIINNYNVTNMAVKPGSMGFPSPGYNVALLDAQDKVVEKGITGEIAVDMTGFPYFFLGYWNNPEKTKEKMRGKWLLTGDLAKQDEDGYFWFQGRSDDIISSAGYRIGPFEVESSLLEHPAVSEAAVVGKPDDAKGEIVKAFIVLNKPYEASADLGKELSTYVKEKLSKHQYPREVEFLDSLPKTQSGKIQRFLLKEVNHVIK
ncbi:acyl-CoA synthetase [Psychrobacillus sp. OK032]|uniref:acyl-CoA synthetase n=1 Tax=Psychrobacillus sp. OK032 TaxID=1884358 RepID=UPI0008BD955C|nr:AMP-binding protein [Psychrobacillus sp. OK032]SER86529.1 acetyl-CoA synthetase [Psychrobacillus sp. OK032]